MKVTFSSKLRKALLAALLSVTLAAMQTASAVNWTGATNGDWWTGTNWNTAFTTNAAAVFATGLPNQSISLDKDTTAGAVSVTGGSYTFNGGGFGLTATTLSVSAGATLTLQNINMNMPASTAYIPPTTIQVPTTTVLGTLVLGPNVTYTGDIRLSDGAAKTTALRGNSTSETSVNMVQLHMGGTGGAAFIFNLGGTGDKKLTIGTLLGTHTGFTTVGGIGNCTINVLSDVAVSDTMYISGAAKAVTIAAGATFEVATLAAAADNLGSGSAFTFSGGTGTFQLNKLDMTNCTAGTWGSTIALNGTTLRLNMNDQAVVSTGGAGMGINNITGAITGAGSKVEMTGTGSVVLSGANTYSGGTEATSGKVIASNATAFGTGAVTFAETASLEVAGTVNLAIAGSASLHSVNFAAAGSGLTLANAINTIHNITGLGNTVSLTTGTTSVSGEARGNNGKGGMRWKMVESA